MATQDTGRTWEDDEPRPRGRRRRWVLLALLLLMLGGAGFYLSWTRSAERRVNDLVERLKRQGEPVVPEDLVHPPIPSDNDAAVDLMAAAALLKDEDPSSPMAKVDFDEQFSRKFVERLKVFVESQRPVMDHVRAARGKTDADWKIPYQSPVMMTLLPHLNKERGLANLCRAAAVLDHLDGDDAAAVDHLLDVLAIGRASDTNPVIVGHLVAIGVTAVGSEQLGRIAPDLKVATGNSTDARAASLERVRQAIRELLDDAPFEKAAHVGLAGERVMILDTMKMLAERKLDLRALSGAAPSPGSAILPVPRGLIMSDTVLVVQNNLDVMRAYEQSPDYQAYKQAAPPLPAAMKNGPKFHFMASILMPSFDRFILQHYRGKTDRRLAATALALRLYAVDHDGKYPQSLDELVPKYLPTVPTDPFASGGKPLRYSTDDPAAPIVYSVSENGTDDGGSRASTLLRRAPNNGRWDKMDAVLEMKPVRLLKTPEEEKKAEADEEAGR